MTDGIFECFKAGEVGMRVMVSEKPGLTLRAAGTRIPRYICRISPSPVVCEHVSGFYWPVSMFCTNHEPFSPSRGLCRFHIVRLSTTPIMHRDPHGPMTPRMQPPPSTSLPEFTPHPARLIAYRWPTLPSRHEPGALNRASDETEA